jgi:hypothetical protein
MVQKRLLYLAGLLAVLMCAIGCAVAVGAAAGAGGFYYIRGEVVRDYDTTMDGADAAIMFTMRSFEFKGISSTKDGLKGKYRARQADDSPVHIHAKMKEDGRIQIRVRIGKIGSRDSGVAFHERLEKHI